MGMLKRSCLFLMLVAGLLFLAGASVANGEVKDLGEVCLVLNDGSVGWPARNPWA
jgi:hypothetical protein